ncbi:uncharacterized protein N7477_001533 [Penicillium maclennaniae]|uniref:uncharacterized protein n=1 Tax=Penicillium maclennaniae TaxID=1343394 RepID=UPI0025421163|nr:uncharacterized protein N7477_001533 [Penicillium maclennaniae]KAJ5681593.1 hypothetical protein N7477_001533 [Penicillium maclennaniae]
MPIMADLLGLSPLRFHYAYFILVPTIASVIFYTASTQIHELHYVDALFMCFSAMTGTGLNVVCLSKLVSNYEQGTLFTLLIIGHSIPIFGVVSLIRLWALRYTLHGNSNKDKAESSAPCAPILQPLEKPILNDKIDALASIMESKETTITAVIEIPADVSTPDDPKAPWNDYGFIVLTDGTHSEQSQQLTSITIISEEKKTSNDKGSTSHKASRIQCIIRRAAARLTRQISIEYDGPGGLEYLALSLISGLVLLYFISFLLLGIIVLGFWSKFVRPDVPQEDHTNPFWAGAFLATSALSNNGMSLIDTNMGPYQKEAFPLLVCGILILAGNTLFPCLLRLLIWAPRAMMPDTPNWQSLRRTFDFTLAKSQNVCAYLYPAWHTWFLLGTVIILNAIMWGAFEVSAIHNEEIRSLPPKFQVLDGLFQALAVRGGGFSVVAFDRLPQGQLILYAFMMSQLLSGIPSLKPASQSSVLTGISSTEITKIWTRKDTNEEENRPRPSSFVRGRFVYHQLRSQFSHDIWWLSLAILLITVTESDHFNTNPLAFSTFNIIFESISAYSCVGVTVGFPGQSFAFCGAWHTFSKLLLIAISLRGRHRGLSVIIDHTALFPHPQGDHEEHFISQDQGKHVAMKEAPLGLV